MMIREKFPGLGPEIDAVFYSKGHNYIFQGYNQLEYDKLSDHVTKSRKAIVGLVVRNGVHQFASIYYVCIACGLCA